jgi:hypothetical protein
MNFFMLSKQLGCVSPSFELGHLLCEEGKYVLFFDCVVGGEVLAELEAGVDELF